jgi:hypothetical protein
VVVVVVVVVVVPRTVLCAVNVVYSLAACLITATWFGIDMLSVGGMMDDLAQLIRTDAIRSTAESHCTGTTRQ